MDLMVVPSDFQVIVVTIKQYKGFKADLLGSVAFAGITLLPISKLLGLCKTD